MDGIVYRWDGRREGYAFCRNKVFRNCWRRLWWWSHEAGSRFRNCWGRLWRSYEAGSRLRKCWGRLWWSHEAGSRFRIGWRRLWWSYEAGSRFSGCWRRQGPPPSFVGCRGLIQGAQGRSLPLEAGNVDTPIHPAHVQSRVFRFVRTMLTLLSTLRTCRAGCFVLSAQS